MPKSCRPSSNTIKSSDGKRSEKCAINSGKTQNLYAGRQALQYLALLDAQKADLNTARLEMIRYILKLRNYVK